MPKRNHFDDSVPPTAVCIRCKRSVGRLQRCCLTGSGDHPGYFLLCDECVNDILANSPAAEHAHQPENPDMTEAEKRSETRRQKTFDRLGTDHPICACCPETDWRCMELHHLEGKDFGKTLTIVCRNCHRKLSDAQKDHTTTKLGTPPTTPESIGHFLQGLADMLLFIAGKLREFGEYLIEQALSQAPKKKPSRT